MSDVKVTTRDQEIIELWSAGQLAPALAELARLLASGELAAERVEQVYTQLSSHKGWAVHVVITPSAGRS